MRNLMLARLKMFESRFRKDHQHPVNRWLHFIGQPLVGIALFLLFFSWLAAAICILAGYSLMFTGHFLFEGNRPGILQNPGYIVVASLAAVSALGHGAMSLWRCVVSPREKRTEKARRQFENLTSFYAGSLAQRCFFKPTHEFLCRFLPRRPNMNVLDVGCGSGRLLAMLPKHLSGVRLVGIDLAGGMLKVARPLLGPDSLLVQGNCQRLPFANKQFDLVICSHSFHHYPDQLAALREMKRVLKDGGVACVLDGDRDDPFGWLLYDVFIRLWEGAVHHASAQEMRRLFRNAGFVELRQERQDSFPPVLLTSGRAAQNAEISRVP
jgi:ubiquinone/menaquinone biosynthesis C-methylase UbiE